MNKFTQKRMVSIVLAILLLLPLEPSGVFAATTVQANPTSSSVLVNGMKVSFKPTTSTTITISSFGI